MANVQGEMSNAYVHCLLFNVQSLIFSVHVYCSVCDVNVQMRFNDSLRYRLYEMKQASRI